jgi:hypothetical protein
VKLRHAAALALIGWYLMVVPPLNSTRDGVNGPSPCAKATVAHAGAGAFS